MPTYKDGKFLNLKISFKDSKHNYSISIKDSYLMLTTSLAKLAKHWCSLLVSVEIG